MAGEHPVGCHTWNPSRSPGSGGSWGPGEQEQEGSSLACRSPGQGRGVLSFSTVWAPPSVLPGPVFINQ